MTSMIEHDDDRVDPVAQALREQAASARLRPSADLRARTIQALRNLPVGAIKPATSRWRGWAPVLAAAAMIAIAIIATWALNHQPLPSADPIAGGNLRTDPLQNRLVDAAPSVRSGPIATTTVRLTSFTRPLEREAEALQADFKRIAERVRSKFPKRDSNQSQTQPAAPTL